MKVSFITTVFNEEKTVEEFLESLLKQTQKPNEIIIVDGGSTDNTIKKIESVFSKHKVKASVHSKKGNRSIGRNEAIKRSKGEIIVCSDSGNILHKDWIKNITKPFRRKNIDVVAGYYKDKSQNVFQKVLSTYTLVMEDKLDPKAFLPATRSIAFKKNVWKKIGGFDERFSHNEDYVFANEIKSHKFISTFAKDAIVYWLPRNNFREAFYMFYRFALGDAESNIFRPKVLLVFLRYFLVLYLIFLSVLYESLMLALSIFSFFILYIVWSIKKNYRYVKNKKALFYLPAMQFTADAAVIIGTSVGLFKGIIKFNYVTHLRKNKLLILLLCIYSSLMLLFIDWGIPNVNHPFTYQMDEWHQSQAVRTTFTQGSPNVEGSANGSMLHFVITGFYLIPFVITGIVNPFAINSSVGNLEMQQRLFEVLRINTLFFGILATFLITYIAKKYYNLSRTLVAFLFIFNPIWLSLSNYFKYDIALIFWILLGFLFLLRFVYKPTFSSFILAGAICAISFAVKVSAIPLLPLYICVFFLYFPNPFKNVPKLLLGVSTYIAIFILFGIPDLIFGAGNIYEYLDSVIRRSPEATSNYAVGVHYIQFLLFQLYPVSFGHILYMSFLASIIFLIYYLAKSFRDKKKSILNIMQEKKAHILFIAAFIIFLVSLLPLKIDARANRLLVLLPFMILAVGLLFTYIYNLGVKRGQKIFVTSVIILAIGVHIFEIFGWMWLKSQIDPRQSSSIWIQKNIKENQTIGIENIPIYQMLPDIVVKEFYFKEYKVLQKNKYNYSVIDSTSEKLPEIIVLTNVDAESNYLIKTPKKDLARRLEKENYKKIAKFEPDFTYYRFYGDDLLFYFSNLVIMPNNITIYSKE